VCAGRRPRRRAETQTTDRGDRSAGRRQGRAQAAAGGPCFSLAIQAALASWNATARMDSRSGAVSCTRGRRRWPGPGPRTRRARSGRNGRRRACRPHACGRHGATRGRPDRHGREARRVRGLLVARRQHLSRARLGPEAHAGRRVRGARHGRRARRPRHVRRAPQVSRAGQVPPVRRLPRARCARRVRHAPQLRHRPAMPASRRRRLRRPRPPARRAARQRSPRAAVPLSSAAARTPPPRGRSSTTGTSGTWADCGGAPPSAALPVSLTTFVSIHKRRSRLLAAGLRRNPALSNGSRWIEPAAAASLTARVGHPPNAAAGRSRRGPPRTADRSPAPAPRRPRRTAPPSRR
jgi:hypothetical protein